MMWIITSVRPDGKRVPVDGEPRSKTHFRSRLAALAQAREFRREDAEAGCDTQIRVRKSPPRRSKE